MIRLKTLLASAALLIGSSLIAQNTVFIYGQVLNNMGSSIQVDITTGPGTLPFTSHTVFTDLAGNFTDTMNLSSTQGILGFTYETCDSTIVSDSAFFSPSPLGVVVNVVLDYCPNMLVDCLGVPGGTALPGSPCDDGDSTTVNDTWTAACVCQGSSMLVDCLGIPGGTALPGTPCNDNDSTTFNDTWSPGCVCQGTSMGVDCLGVPGGTALPFTPCDDGDPNTVNDMWTQGCACVGTPVNTPCNATFNVWQPIDSLTGMPISGTVNVMLLNTSPIFGYSFMWDFGDGNTSTSPWPTHTYTGNGPYLLCLTITGPGCASTYCDTVAVDTSGIIIPGQPGASGFTINVIPNGATSIDETPDLLNDLTLAPNPAVNELFINLNSLQSANAVVRVFDFTGKEVILDNISLNSGSNRARIATDQLENGGYILRIEANGTALTKRFVKMIR